MAPYRFTVSHFEKLHRSIEGGIQAGMEYSSMRWGGSVSTRMCGIRSEALSPIDRLFWRREIRSFLVFSAVPSPANFMNQLQGARSKSQAVARTRNGILESIQKKAIRESPSFSGPDSKERVGAQCGSRVATGC